VEIVVNPTLDAHLTFLQSFSALFSLDWRPKLNSRTLATAQVKLEGTNKI
jgi:hypothetical protein